MHEANWGGPGVRAASLVLQKNERKCLMGQETTDPLNQGSLLNISD